MSEHAYRDAGVDIDLEAAAVKALIGQLSYRRQGPYPMMGQVGHFAGLIDFGPVALALAVDGVGTKMLIADHQENWKTVGIDCIAMNVNDLYVMNMEPIAFVDYIATDRLSLEKMTEIGIGLNEGARQANMNIVGGETASLAGLVNGLDLAGACLGVQQKERIITGESIRPSDLVIGVPSTGVHSNGLSLARRIAETHEGYDQEIRPGKTLGEELLTPTRIYAEVPAITATHEVHGMCHITGGGLLNFTRLSGYGIAITDPLPPQQVFTWMQETGGVSEAEMYRTFNMGMGYALVVPPDAADGIVRDLPGAQVVGSCTKEASVTLCGTEIR